MRQMIRFFLKLCHEIKKDEIMSLSNEMTYKGLLALFPFLIFTMSILGFLNLDSNVLLRAAEPYFAPQIMDIIMTFIKEVFGQKNGLLLSASLLIALFSAASGQKAVMRGVNLAYGITKKRNMIHTAMLSLLLVFLFAMTVILSFFVLIFGDQIKDFLSAYITGSAFLWDIWGAIVTCCVLIVILFAVTLMYKLSLTRRTTLKSLLPGAAVTVVLWVLASGVFNIYINNFSRYSKVYGSIGSVFILMLWLNLLGFILLVGSEINALLEEADA